MKKNLKNRGLWVALFSLIGLLVNDFTDIAPERYNAYVDIVLGLLVAAGIISNPKDGNWFTDKEK
jgi:uncharacterized membrane protein